MVGNGSVVGDGWCVSRFSGFETPRPTSLPCCVSLFPWIHGRRRRALWVTGAQDVRRLEPSDAGSIRACRSARPPHLLRPHPTQQRSNETDHSSTGHATAQDMPQHRTRQPVTGHGTGHATNAPFSLLHKTHYCNKYATTTFLQ
jgi:hypothetical protein